MTDISDASTLLMKAFRRLLRPLVGLAIRFGIPYPTLSNLLKAVYVEVANADFPVADRPQTHSRITVLTGVHRKDVKRLLADEDGEDQLPATPTLGAQIIGKWLGDPAFTDAAGRPLVLPRSTSDGTASFDSLVETVSKDVRPRTILDEWTRLGIASLDAEGCVTLHTAAYVPARGLEQKAHFFGRNLRDHIAAAAHNVIGEGPPMLERAVFYDRLSPASVEALRKMADEGGMDLLLRLNREALKLSERDEGAPAATCRMTLGVYFYEKDDSEKTALT